MKAPQRPPARRTRPDRTTRSGPRTAPTRHQATHESGNGFRLPPPGLHNLDVTERALDTTGPRRPRDGYARRPSGLSYSRILRTGTGRKSSLRHVRSNGPLRRRIRHSVKSPSSTLPRASARYPYPFDRLIHRTTYGTLRRADAGLLVSNRLSHRRYNMHQRLSRPASARPDTRSSCRRRRDQRVPIGSRRPEQSAQSTQEMSSSWNNATSKT